VPVRVKMERELLAVAQLTSLCDCTTRSGAVSVAQEPKNVPKAYQETGYWVGPKIFDDRSVADLRTACSKVLSGVPDGASSPHFLIDDTQPVGGLRRAFNASFVNSAVRTAIYNSAVGEIAAHLMGVTTVRLWYSQIIEKPPSDTSASGLMSEEANIGWHQDYRYWQCCEHPNMVTAWVALQDTARANGAMRVVVGSNNWGLLPAERGFNTRNIEEIRDTLQTQIHHKWVEHDCALMAGQVSFHHALTLHGSGPNASSEARIGIAVHLMPGNAKRRQGPLCHHSLTFLEPMPAPNERFEGEQWPIIWPAAPNT
jgi:ectoine hydroxylase-related dioxygenase (phytanoyl-CoA dioxygenase family)